MVFFARKCLPFIQKQRNLNTELFKAETREKKMKEKLAQIGVEYDEVLQRFMGKEDFYLRMLKKFLDDKNYEGLKQTVEQKDWAGAFTYAHTVKGLCGNLGLGAMLEYIVPLTEEVRSAPYNEESIMEYMQNVSSAYEKTIEAIQSL